MRMLTSSATSDAQRLLSVLADTRSSTEAYREAMLGLGGALGRTIAAENPSIRSQQVYLVCTVEDADFLARGMLSSLQEAGVPADRIRVACFWNERVRQFEGSDRETFDIAPIVKAYREDGDVSTAMLVMVKSIISGACVVKTNLSALIEKATPAKVIVAAPVMVRGADERLAAEFPEETARRFSYVTFALDDPAGPNHLVEPGIGGSVYARLGMDDKTSYVPNLVRERRAAAAA